MKFLITVENCIKIANCTKASHVERKSFECNMYNGRKCLIKRNLCVYDTSPALHNGTYLNCNFSKKILGNYIYQDEFRNYNNFLNKISTFTRPTVNFCLFCREMSSEAGIPLLPSLCKVK